MKILVTNNNKKSKLFVVPFDWDIFYIYFIWVLTNIHALEFLLIKF